MLEIGSAHGRLTMRAGRDDGQLVCIVLPVPCLPGFTENLQHARLDAEEEYWRVIQRITTFTRVNGPGGVPRDVDRHPRHDQPSASRLPARSVTYSADAVLPRQWPPVTASASVAARDRDTVYTRAESG
ncbi:hypothetical protein ACG93S_32675 [Streptomyces sp. WAC01490]|uniref:hypothetical protein n=1 Tax=unclassified Streptomyces TaxID=2593676 RepID=UPI003F304F21